MDKGNGKGKREGRTIVIAPLEVDNATTEALRKMERTKQRRVHQAALIIIIIIIITRTMFMVLSSCLEHCESSPQRRCTHLS